MTLRNDSNIFLKCLVKTSVNGEVYYIPSVKPMTSIEDIGAFLEKDFSNALMKYQKTNDEKPVRYQLFEHQYEEMASMVFVDAQFLDIEVTHEVYERLLVRFVDIVGSIIDEVKEETTNIFTQAQLLTERLNSLMESDPTHIGLTVDGELVELDMNNFEPLERVTFDEYEEDEYPEEMLGHLS